MFEALRKVNNPAIRFIVMGDGPLKEEFENKAAGLNVNFVGRLPYEQMCGVLTACDMVVNPIVGRSAATIINKHADYAASGLPVMNTQECEEYRNLVDEYKMGFNCNNNDPQDLAEKIILLMNDEQLRSRMGANARKCAEEKFDRRISYNEIIDTIGAK